MSKHNDYAVATTNHEYPMFNVVFKQTIGTVYEGGEHTPREAAFLLIARSNLFGSFEFPTEDGGTEVITVQQMPESAIIPTTADAPIKR